MRSAADGGVTARVTGFSNSTCWFSSRNVGSLNQSISTGLRALTDEVALQALTDWHLHETEVPAHFATAEGRVRDHGVRMVTRRFCGSRYRHVTVARIDDDQGQALSATVIALPQPTVPMPVICADLVAIGGELSLVAVDLAPTDPQTWQVMAAPLLEVLRQRVEGHIIERKRPSFTASAFSPKALIVAAKKGAEATVLHAVLTFFRSLSPVVNHVGGDGSSDHDAALREWVRVQLANRKEHDALSRIFGAAFTERYLGDFLFSL
jgi:hypothetical protein